MKTTNKLLIAGTIVALGIAFYFKSKKNKTTSVSNDKPETTGTTVDNVSNPDVEDIKKPAETPVKGDLSPTRPSQEKMEQAERERLARKEAEKQARLRREREQREAERERERRIRLHRERLEAERREQERLQREREERNEQGVLYLSRGSDDSSQICNESTVSYVAKYKPPFARGVQIRGVRVSGNVDSFKILKATGDAKAFVGKRIIIDDDNKLKSINNCNTVPKPKPKLPILGGIDLDIPLFDLDAVGGNKVNSRSRSTNMPNEIYGSQTPRTRNSRFTGDTSDVDLLNLQVH